MLKCQGDDHPLEMRHHPSCWSTSTSNPTIWFSRIFLGQNQRSSRHSMFLAAALTLWGGAHSSVKMALTPPMGFNTVSDLWHVATFYLIHYLIIPYRFLAVIHFLLASFLFWPAHTSHTHLTTEVEQIRLHWNLCKDVDGYRRLVHQPWIGQDWVRCFPIAVFSHLLRCLYQYRWHIQPSVTPGPYLKTFTAVHDDWWCLLKVRVH